jgi:3',5'-cyclic AMP phosphodiesterase CpdA
VTLLFHLSDLHMTHSSAQQVVLDRLVDAMRAERAAAGAGEGDRRAAVVITGDVFDSATDATGLIEAFLQLHARMLDALGAGTPTVVLPGNHDRRRVGVLGPHREKLFLSLARAAEGRRILVAGTSTPFLAQVVPSQLHGMPAHVVAYDSSYLPHGLVGAGGTIRLEDLLQVHAQLPRDDHPLVVLVHHHLIPTPVTDISGVDHTGAPRIARWLLGVAVPALVSNADREELTMTALGAGTALSALHTFGRPVLLLHGHKHVPTARILRGMTDDCGDLLLASAGTAGRRERVHATRHPDAARLWPTFNVIAFDGDAVRVDSVSFFPKGSSRPSIRRVLARVHRSGPKWEVEPMTFRASDPSPRVRRDEARYALSVSADKPERWDMSCERTIELVEGARLRRYVDFVHSLPPVLARARARAARRANRRVELSPNGTTRYEIAQALCRTLAEGSRSYGVGTAFEWVGLLCRYGAARATLRLARAGAEGIQPFASATDLTTGRERPIAVTSTEEEWTVSAETCPPRSLLRMYWPLARS